MRAKIYCIAYGCMNNDRDPDLAFFSLPKDLERRRKWLTLIDRQDLLEREVLKRTSHVVCSAHFEDSAIKFIKHVKKDAVPTLRLFKQMQEDSSSSQTESTSQIKGDENIFSNVFIKEELICSEAQPSAQIKDEPDEIFSESPETQCTTQVKGDENIISNVFIKEELICSEAQPSAQIKDEPDEIFSESPETQYTTQVKGDENIISNVFIKEELIYPESPKPSVQIKNEPDEIFPESSETQCTSQIKGDENIISNVFIKVESIPSESICSEAQTPAQIKDEGDEILLSNNVIKAEKNATGTQTESQIMEEQTQPIKSLTEPKPSKRKLIKELREYKLKRRKLDQEIVKLIKETKQNKRVYKSKRQK